MVYKLEGSDTRGSFAIVEHPIKPGTLVPPRTHAHEDEFSYVLEGEIGVRIGFEKYFAEMAALFRGDDLPDFEQVTKLAGRYGLGFQLEWVPELTERYNLKLLGRERPGH